MAAKFDLYTGTLKYRDIDFMFAFDEEELRLVPPNDKRHVVDWDWKMKETTPGSYVFADPILVEEPYLIGKCNETNHNIIFIPKTGSTLGLYNSVVRISLAAYVICKYDRDNVDRISFSCPEINYIHPVNQALSLSLSADDFQEKGIVSISTQDYDSTTTEEQHFLVDGKTITVFFGISRAVSTKINEPPLRVDSSMVFEFEPSCDFGFIYRLWWIARQFLRFLCYRKNIVMTKVELSSPCQDGKHETFATMYILGQDSETETNTLTKGRYIKQSYISGHEGEILTDIAQDNLYLRHLPDTYRSGRHIDAARFVMITAAFEWEFHRLYPDGVKKTPATKQAEDAVFECIQKHIDDSTGKQKGIFKFLRKLVRSDSLQKEIIQMGKDFSAIIGPFGDRLYQLNDQELKYSEMGQRLADQRNHFAHGDLNKEFIGLSLLDLIYMEYVVYALQLKHYGIEDKLIQKSINDLFHLNFAI